jgi:SPP1 family predicted phage head-tail adaptor
MAVLRQGDLEWRVQIQTPIYTDNTDGEQQITGWTPVQDLWASIKSLTGREYLQSLTVQAQVTCKIIIHYWPTLTTDCRIQSLAPIAGRNFDIVSVLNDFDSRLITTVMAIERLT